MQTKKPMKYNFCGKSGLQLPQVSLGMWHNFGSVDSFANAREMLLTAFDNGITHFDLANNYGPEPGSAELTLGRVLREDLMAHRDELVISSKAASVHKYLELLRYFGRGRVLLAAPPL